MGHREDSRQDVGAILEALRKNRDARLQRESCVDDLLAALHEALEFAEDQEDVVDGPDGVPQANKAMQLAMSLRAAISKAEGA